MIQTWKHKNRSVVSRSKLTGLHCQPRVPNQEYVTKCRQAVKRNHRGTKGNETAIRANETAIAQVTRVLSKKALPSLPGHQLQDLGVLPQEGLGVGVGKNIPYSHTCPCLCPILVLIQHDVENCFIATHQICDPNQPRWRTPCVNMQTYMHMWAHTYSRQHGYACHTSCMYTVKQSELGN